MHITDYALSHFICDIGHSSGVFFHDFRQTPRPANGLAYILEGEGEFGSNDRIDPVNPGDLVLTPQGSTYYQNWNPARPYRYISCRFIFRTPPPILRERRLFVQRIGGMEDTLADFRWIYENRQNPDAAMGVLARFWGLLHRTLRELDGAPLPPADPILAPAIAYIDANCVQPLRVAELASLCHLSESHFYARFKKAVGCSPIEYKHRAMILKSRLLLSDEPSLSIEEISERTGFASAAYFRRIFRAESGMSPRQYREKERNSF